MKYCLYVVLLIGMFIYADNKSLAQDSLSARNSAYGELGGNCVLLSFNYERVVISDIAVKAGIGFSVFPRAKNSKSSDTDLLFYPFYNLMAQYFYRFTRYSSFGVNFGLGATISNRDNVVFATGKIGFRYSPYDEGFLFDLSYTPFWDPEGIVSWFGIGIGTSF